MRLRIGLLLMVLLALGVFAALTWSASTASTEINLLFARVVAPVGVILLVAVLGVAPLCAALLVWLETAALFEARRHARELDAQRELAQNGGGAPARGVCAVRARRSVHGPLRPQATMEAR